MKLPWPLSGQGCGTSLAVLGAGTLQVRGGFQCSPRTSGPQGSTCCLLYLIFVVGLMGIYKNHCVLKKI